MPARRRRVGQKAAPKETAASSSAADSVGETSEDEPMSEDELLACRWSSSSDNDELQRALSQLHAYLSDVPQAQSAADTERLGKVSAELYRLCVKFLGGGGTTSSRRSSGGGRAESASSVRVLTALCLADVLRIYAPEPPYSDAALVKIFHLMIVQLQKMDDPTAKEFGLAAQLLYLLALCHSFVLVADLDRALLEEVFERLMSIVNCGGTPGQRQSSLVIGCVLDIMVSCLEECGGVIEPALLDIIFRPLAAAAAADDDDDDDSSSSSSSSTDNDGVEATDSYHLVRQVVLRAGEHLRPAIANFFNAVLSPHSRQSTFRADDKLQIFFALHQIEPSLVVTVVPSLQEQLLREDDESRRKLVRLLTRLFLDASHGDPCAAYPLLYNAFCARFADRDRAVRRAMLVDFAGPYMRRYPDRADALVAAVKQRALDPDPAVRAAVVAVAADLAAVHVPDVASPRAAAAAAALLDAVQHRLRDTEPSVRDASIRRFAALFRHYVDKFGPLSDWSEAKLAMVAWIPAKLLALYYQPHVDIQNEVLSAVASLFLVDVSHTDDNDNDNDNDDDKKEATKKKKKKPSRAQQQRGSLIDRHATVCRQQVAVLGSIVHALTAGDEGGTGLQALTVLLRDKFFFRKHVQQFLLDDVDPDALDESASVARIRGVVSAQDDGRRIEALARCLGTHGVGPLMKAALLRLVDPATPVDDACRAYAELQALPSSAFEPHFEPWFRKLCDRLAPVVVHPDVVVWLAKTLGQRGAFDLAQLLDFLLRLADFTPQPLFHCVADGSDLAGLLFTACDTSRRASSSGQSAAHLPPNVVESVLRIMAKLSAAAGFTAAASKTSRLTALLLRLCDCRAGDSLGAPTAAALHARLALRVLVRTGSATGGQLTKLAQHSADELASVDVDELDAAACVAVENLASLAKHAPDKLAAAVGAVVDGVYAALDAERLPVSPPAALVAWLRAGVRLLLHCDARPAGGERSRRFVQLCLALLGVGSAEPLRASAAAALLQLWADKAVQRGGEHVFAACDLARLAWSLPGLAAATREALSAKLFKLTRATNAHAFLAFHAFFALQPDHAALPKIRQQFVNSALLRRKSHVDGQIHPELWSFFLLALCLHYAAAESDVQAVLKYYVKVVAGPPQRGDKDDPRNSLAQVVFAVQRMHLKRCAAAGPQPLRRICELALRVLGTEPERNGPSAGQFLSALPWLQPFYALQPDTTAAAAAATDQQQLALSAPARQRKQPATPARKRPVQRRPRTPTTAAASSKRPRQADKPPVTPSRTSLPRSCKNATPKKFDSDDEEEEEEHSDNDSDQSSDDDQQATPVKRAPFRTR